MSYGKAVVRDGGSGSSGGTVEDRADQAASDAVRAAQNAGASKADVIRARESARAGVYTEAFHAAGSSGGGSDSLSSVLSQADQTGLYNAGLIDTREVSYTRGYQGDRPQSISVGLTDKAQAAYQAGANEAAAANAAAVQASYQTGQSGAETVRRQQAYQNAIDAQYKEAAKAGNGSLIPWQPVVLAGLIGMGQLEGAAPLTGAAKVAVDYISEKIPSIHEYITAGDGKYGYTNKIFDATYEPEKTGGTLTGKAVELGTSLFNAVRTETSAVATAVRYWHDKDLEREVQNYVDGADQRKTFDQTAAALIRNALNDPLTTIHHDDNTGSNYIIVRNVKVPLEVAENAALDVYNGSEKALEVRNDTKYRYYPSKLPYAIRDVSQYILDTIKIDDIQNVVNKAIDERPVSSFSPGISLFAPNFAKELGHGLVDAGFGLVKSVPVILNSLGKSYDIPRSDLSNLPSVYGSAIAELTAGITSPTLASIQESNYTAEELAYVAGGLIFDYATGKVGSIAKNRGWRPAKAHLKAELQNLDIAKTNNLNLLKTEADVAADASKRLGIPVDYRFVQEKLPNIYNYDPTTASYKVEYMKPSKISPDNVIQGNNLAAGGRAEQRILEALGDTNLKKFGYAMQNADYLEANWGNPTKFLPENQPRSLRMFASEKINDLTVNPEAVYADALKLGKSPLDALEDSLKAIEFNRRTEKFRTKLSDTVRGTPETNAVEMAAKKKKFADESRRRYGDFVSRTDVEDIAKFTKMPETDAASLLKGLG
ncbi:MAG: hypothetical protein LBU81_06330, partial [Methanosarcinales archaeon]|nr:hypothetical protein [Methanosarcinales archaeon]